VRVEFDRERLSYEELIRDHYFANPQTRPSRWQGTPDPSWPPVALRARTKGLVAVWAQDKTQAVIARRVADELGKSAVPVLAASAWYDAEDRHFSRKPRNERPTNW